MIKNAEDNELEVTDVIPFGIPALDNLLCVRSEAGSPRRRILEVTGDFSLGKTSLCLLAVRQAQAMGLKCLWYDAEYAWDNLYAKALGVDLKDLHLLHERVAETGLDILEEMAEKGKYQLIVIDSIKRLVPQEQLEKSNSGKLIGAQARMVTGFISKIGGLLSEKNILLIVINDDFQDLTTMKLKSAGGRQLSKDKSIWLRLTNAQKPIKQGDKIIGKTVTVEIRKNKLKETEKEKVNLELLFGQGFLAEKREPRKRGRPPLIKSI